jgi:hypothetical protein
MATPGWVSRWPRPPHLTRRPPYLVTVRALALAGAVCCVLWLAAPAQASDAEQTTYRFRAAVKHLEVARQTHQSSYNRTEEFGDWIDQHNGCDTRAVVLLTESRVPITRNDYCTVQTGRWRSYYNATTYTSASALQIDHVVPVENVWVTGGWQWTQATRVAYYNDLDDPRTLVAVDSHDNESKGDRTPDEWLPPDNHCRYVREFVSVKLRWQLTVTRVEKKAIKSVAASCANAQIAYLPADISFR